MVKLVEIALGETSFFTEMKKENAAPISWRELMSGGWSTVFSLDDKQFQIEIKQQNSAIIFDNYDIDISQLNGLTIYRADYHQIVDGKPVYANTNNMGVKAGRVIGTVIHGIGNLLQHRHYNILYFLAKPYSDGSKNQRMTMYPALAEMMTKEYGGVAQSFNFDGQVLTVVLNNMSAEKQSDLNDALYKELHHLGAKLTHGIYSNS